MIKAILFDMDGTLLPMDIDVFTRAYFVELVKRMAAHGYDKDELFNGVWQGTGAMISNDGSRTNEQVFWDVFSSVCGKRVLDDKPFFDDFYETYFDNVRESCGFDPSAAECVRAAKETGCIVILASNPIFPRTAQLKRARWAGVDPDMFDFVTSYENCSYCKPNERYYLDILREFGLAPDECLMIGNDVGEDMVVAELGMETFLVTPCMINRVGADVSEYRRGDLNDLKQYLASIKKQ